MAKVTGLGGIFFKARDPKGLSAWYAQHLGLRLEEFGGALFPEDTAYFAPSTRPFMVNFRVDDLPALLTQLRGAGIQVDARVEESEYGRFGWIMDPEGNRVELWEPPQKT